MDWISTSDYQTSFNCGPLHSITSVEKDLPPIKWCSTGDKVGKILGETLLYGSTGQNLSG
jgi:hypothetical protein